MTYNSRPMYGIKESFYGPAAYREAEYQQSTKNYLPSARNKAGTYGCRRSCLCTGF